MIKTDILVVGGGVAGLSTAYFLGKHGQRSVIVLEQEKKLGGHASGRNAGMLRQALPDPILAKLAKQSRAYFDTLGSDGWKKVSLWKNGSIILSKEAKRTELEHIHKTLTASGIRSEWLPRWKVIEKVPVLADADFSIALFCPSDAMLELAPLLEGFRANLKRRGIQVLFGLRLEKITPEPKGGYVVRAGGKEIFAKRIVNAAGAWASWVAREAGAAPVPLEPYRRHLFTAKSAEHPDKSTRSWPFVWDVNADFYFRPLVKGLLVSPCDKTLEKDGDRKEKVHPETKSLLLAKMKRFSIGVSRWKVDGALSGLRTMTPDGRFVVGQDPKKKDFYWVAGLGGHGVTTCFSVGQMAANLMLGNKVDGAMRKALSPGRF